MVSLQRWLEDFDRLVSGVVTSSCAIVISGADFDGSNSKQSYAAMLSGGCIGGAVPRGTSFLKAPQIVFVAVAVTFVLLHSLLVGVMASNPTAIVGLVEGSSDGWFDVNFIWCHACTRDGNPNP